MALDAVKAIFMEVCRDGVMSRAELQDFVRLLTGWGDLQSEALLQHLDWRGDGRIQVEELVDWVFRIRDGPVSVPTREARGSCQFSDFGEEEEDEKGVAKAHAAAAEGEDVWQVQSQQTIKLGREKHCTLTILVNKAEGLLRFSVLRPSDGQTVVATCTNEHFDDRCRELSSLSGPAQINAAIDHLFHEAMESLEDAALDDFGEDDGADLATVPKESPQEGEEERWQVQSQQQIAIGKEKHCTLTILESKLDRLLRFSALRPSTGDTITATCNHSHFDDLCKEQVGLTGPRQVNAAIVQLFREAMEVVEEQEVDDFGEDSGPPMAMVKKKACDDIYEEEDAWQVQCQQPFQLGKESHCTLTILENKREGLLKFSVLRPSNGKNVVATCTNEHFEDICKEQVGLSGPAQISAAIDQLFREAMQTLEDAAVDEFGEDDGIDVARKGSIDPLGIDDEEEIWHIQSQQAMQIGDEKHCTLTMLENKADGLLRFSALLSRNGETITRQCTAAEFDIICKEQVGLSSPAQITAAICRLFAEASRGGGPVTRPALPAA